MSHYSKNLSNVKCYREGYAVRNVPMRGHIVSGLNIILVVRYWHTRLLILYVLKLLNLK